MDTGYQVFQIDEQSWRIEENGVRSFLLVGTEKALLLDTGFGTGDLRRVVAGLTDLSPVLVNTHADRDHIGCNAQFGPAHMHPAEYHRYHQAHPGAPVAPLWEGDALDLGGRSLTVLLIPGHTPGSIALLEEDRRVLIGGDSVQAGNIFMFGPGRDLEAYRYSMERLQSLITDRVDTVYPSHGPFPVFPAILNGLIAGADRILAGEVPGEPATFVDATAVLRDVGVARFLCNPQS